MSVIVIQRLLTIENFYCDRNNTPILVNGSLKISCTDSDNSLSGKCRLATEEDFDKICDALHRYDKDLVSVKGGDAAQMYIVDI